MRHRSLAFAFCCWLFTITSVASAETGRVILRPLGPSRAAPLAAAPTNFTMLPSVLTSTLSPYGAGPQRLQATAACVLEPSGVIVPHCDLTIRWNARNGSGGHVHNTKRPPGIFTTENGVTGGSTDPGPPGMFTDNTGPSGILGVAYTSPEASGITDLTVTGVAIVNGVPANFGPDQYTIGVQIDGLQPASGAGLQVATFSNMHDSNNGYATADTGTGLQNMAEFFASDLTGQGTPPTQVPTLVVSALSLPEGGLFDYSVEWTPPHVSHRFGNDADVIVELLFDDERAALARDLRDAKFTTPVPCESPSNLGANHWHLRLP